MATQTTNKATNNAKIPPCNLSKQSRETVTAVHILALVLEKLTKKTVTLLNVKFQSKVKVQTTYQCEINEEEVESVKSKIEPTFNSFVDQSLAISTTKITESPQSLPQGLAPLTHPDLVSFVLFGHEKTLGYSAVSVVNNTAELVGCLVLKANYNSKKSQLDVIVQIGKGTRESNGSNLNDKKAVATESMVKQYSGKIMSRVIDELEHRKLLSSAQLTEEDRESLIEDIEECLVQLQNISYTRGLFAGQGKKTL